MKLEFRDYGLGLVKLGLVKYEVWNTNNTPQNQTFLTNLDQLARHSPHKSNLSYKNPALPKMSFSSLISMLYKNKGYKVM